MNEALETEKRVRAYLGNLYTSNREARKEILAELVRLGAPAVPGLVLAACGKPDRNMQARLSGLDSWSRAQRIEEVRKESETALLSMGETAVAPLIQILQGKNIAIREQVALILNRLGEPAVASVTELLNNKDATVRDAAVIALGGAKNEQTLDALRSRLRELLERQRQLKLLRKKLILPCILFFLAVPILKHFFPIIPIGVVQLPFQFMLALYLIPVLAANNRRKVVAILIRSADMTTLGTLIRCLEEKSSDMDVVAADALKVLLPQVKASDRQYVSDAEIAILLKQLDGTDFTLTVAILKALEQIGDEKALQQVERMAQLPYSRNYPKRVVEAAQECLPFLQQRAEQSRQANTLLRASESSTSPETLLRAAQEETSVPPEELLRPRL